MLVPPNFVLKPLPSKSVNFLGNFADVFMSAVSGEWKDYRYLAGRTINIQNISPTRGYDGGSQPYDTIFVFLNELMKECNRATTPFNTNHVENTYIFNFVDVHTNYVEQSCVTHGTGEIIIHRVEQCDVFVDSCASKWLLQAQAGHNMTEKILHLMETLTPVNIYNIDRLPEETVVFLRQKSYLKSCRSQIPFLSNCTTDKGIVDVNAVVGTVNTYSTVHELYYAFLAPKYDENQSNRRGDNLIPFSKQYLEPANNGPDESRRSWPESSSMSSSYRQNENNESTNPTYISSPTNETTGYNGQNENNESTNPSYESPTTETTRDIDRSTRTRGGSNETSTSVGGSLGSEPKSVDDVVIVQIPQESWSSPRSMSASDEDGENKLWIAANSMCGISMDETIYDAASAAERTSCKSPAEAVKSLRRPKSDDDAQIVKFPRESWRKYHSMSAADDHSEKNFFCRANSSVEISFDKTCREISDSAQRRTGQSPKRPIRGKAAGVNLGEKSLQEFIRTQNLVVRSEGKTWGTIIWTVVKNLFRKNVKTEKTDGDRRSVWRILNQNRLRFEENVEGEDNWVVDYFRSIHVKQKIAAMYQPQQTLGANFTEYIGAIINYTITKAEEKFWRGDLGLGQLEEDHVADFPNPEMNSRFSCSVTAVAPSSFSILQHKYEMMYSRHKISIGKPWNDLAGTSGGRTTFYSSEKGHYVIKTLANRELSLFRKIFPAYFLHLLENEDSLLAKLHGIYVYRKNGAKKILASMENVFMAEFPFHEKYNIKGNLHRVKNPGKTGPVLKDIEFLKAHFGGIYVPLENWRRFFAVLERDTKMLEESNIIDYSLLMGIHYCEGEAGLRAIRPNSANVIPAWTPGGRKMLIKFGVVDVFKEYDRTNQLIGKVKTISRRKANVSFVDPVEYRNRFLLFMMRLFLPYYETE